eukprot:scaffold2951_cov192-Amphora_coffeaeformis.AAC.4
MFISSRVFHLILALRVSCLVTCAFSVRPRLRAPTPVLHPPAVVAVMDGHRDTDARFYHNDKRRRRDTSLHAIMPSLPLIAAGDTWGNLGALVCTASLAQHLGESKIGRLLGPPVTAMAITFALATVGVLNPGGTVAARSLQLLSLQLATPLILLGADLRDAFRRCGPMLVSFLVASMATLLACVIGWPMVGSQIESALGRDGLVIAASLMAKNIGGGLNYMAVCSSLQASPTAIAAGLCVDNIFALVYFPLTSLIATGRPDFPLTDGAAVADEVASVPVSVESASLALSLSAVLLWLGEKIGGSTGALPLCTLLTVIFASQAPYKLISKVQSTAQTMGVVCLYLFFSTAGSPGLAVADSVKASVLPLGLFLGMLYSIHGAVLYLFHLLFGRRWKAFQVQPLLCASSAAIGGPATAVALAEAFDWKSLCVPSLLVGNIGYAIATFVGLAYHALFR